VVAFAGGGALETVIPGVTGIWFTEQTVEGIIQAVEQLDVDALDTAVIRKHAEQYDVSVFRAQFQTYVEEKWAQHKAEKTVGQARGHRA
jgi:glycosyltransferase involved in cell wall biosynthesis